MEIHWRNPGEVPESERTDAEARLRALAEGNTDLIDIWVDLEKSSHHRHGAAEVAIRCQARGADLVAREKNDELVPALRMALDRFEREVRKLRDKRTDRRVERPPSPPNLGIVDRVFRDRDHGFILTDGGEQVYFHRNAVRADELDFDALEEGQRVALNYEPGDKGPQATVVHRPPPDAPAP